METMTNGNCTNKNFHKSRNNATFSQVPLNKSDVGDFQAGYFVMVEPSINENQLPQTRSKNVHRTPERYLTDKRKSENINARPHRGRSPKDLDLNIREGGDTNVSNARLTTSPSPSPARSPNRNRRHSSSQPAYSDSIVPLSPHKPRKAQYEKHVDKSEGFSLDSGSPPKEKGSPKPNRWAGPAFSNAPPPSSLPLPDFPPFNPQSSSLSSSPASSPSSSPPPTFTVAPPIPDQEPYIYIQPPIYSHPQPYPVPMAHFSNIQFAYTSLPIQPTLAQLSTDLRRMLNINEQPIPA